MYILRNDKGEIVGYSTSKVNPAMTWTDEEIVEAGSKMFLAWQTEEIEKAKAEYEIKSKKQEEIEQIKAELSATDYKCLKYVDGALTEEEYAEVKKYRADLRKQINELEK